MSLKWFFNASPKALGAQGTSYSIGFTSGAQHFTILRNGTVFKEKFYLYYNDTEAYKSGWKQTAFRTVEFDEEPTGALLTYLEANATAIQEDPYKFKHFYRNERLIGSGTYKFRPYTAIQYQDVFSITNVLSNVTADGENPTTIAANDSVTLIYTAASGYKLPSSITVTNATFSWEPSTGVLDLSNPTGNVTVTISGVAAVTSYSVKINASSSSNYTSMDDDILSLAVDGVTKWTSTWSISSQTVNKDLGSGSTVTLKCGQMYSTISYTMGGVAHELSYDECEAVASANGLTINLTGNFVLTNFVVMCLTGDTLITMFDGAQKRIDALTTGEKILSIDHETNELEADEITYCDSDENKTHAEYDVYTLSDGTKLKTVHRHRFYNLERQAMVYMDEWNIGEHCIKIDGSAPMLIAHEKVAETVQHYTIFTRKNQNYFANGVLSGNRYTRKITIKGDLQK